MKIKNIIKALQDQLPISRLLRNIWKGNLKGLFHKRSHYREDGTAKVTYYTKTTAIKSALKMAEKKGKYYSNYKCPHCDGYHIGKNSENK